MNIRNLLRECKEMNEVLDKRDVGGADVDDLISVSMSLNENLGNILGIRKQELEKFLELLKLYFDEKVDEYYFFIKLTTEVYE